MLTWTMEQARVVSIPPEGRQVQHPLSPSRSYGCLLVSIRPEGRQVQHRVRARQVDARRAVSIRPEGRQVQHRLPNELGEWLEGLNPSRRTAGSSPAGGRGRRRFREVSIRPEGRQVQHLPPPPADRDGDTSQSVPKDGRFSTAKVLGITTVVVESQSVPKDGRFSTRGVAMTQGNTDPSQSVPKDGRFSTSSLGACSTPDTSLNPSRRTAGSARPVSRR